MRRVIIQVELKIDLDSNTVMLVGPPHGGGRRYSTTAVLSYHAPTVQPNGKRKGNELWEKGQTQPKQNQTFIYNFNATINKKGKKMKIYIKWEIHNFEKNK